MVVVWLVGGVTPNSEVGEMRQRREPHGLVRARQRNRANEFYIYIYIYLYTNSYIYEYAIFMYI